MEENEFETNKLNNRRPIKNIIGIVIGLILIIILYLLRHQIASLQGLGYIGLFILCMVANATVLFPIPSSAIILGFVASLQPIYVGMVGGFGAALGELLCYYIGFNGTTILENTKYMRLVNKYFNKHSLIVVFMYSLLPIPMFDIVGVNAGLSRIPIVKYFLVCLLGKIGKMISYAYLSGKIYNILQL